jgi:hypothetical protein
MNSLKLPNLFSKVRKSKPSYAEKMLEKLAERLKKGGRIIRKIVRG